MGFDGQAELAVLLVDICDARIYAIAHCVSVRPLLAPFAGQIGPTDEARQPSGNRNFEPTFRNRSHRTGDRVTLCDPIHRRCERIVGKLLDAEADSFLLGIDIENTGFDHLALFVLLDRFFTVKLPRKVGQMDHTVDLASKADEQTKFGNVLDLALDLAAGREIDRKRIPGIIAALLEPEADPPFLRVDLQHHYIDFLTGGNDLAGMDILFRPAHLGYVDKTLDARLQLHKGAIIGDVADATGEFRADRVFQLDAFPRIRIELLHAERNALGFGIVANDLDLDSLTNRQSLGRMVDAAPRYVGDMQQAIDAAKIDERTVIGDVLDHAFENLAFREVGKKLVALFGAGFFEDGAARYHDIAAPAIHLENLERLRRAHKGANIADRTHVYLAARQKRHGAGKIDGESAFYAAENRTRYPFGFLESDLKERPRLFTAGAFSAENGFAIPVFHPFQIDVDDIADLNLGGLTRHPEFLKRNAALGFKTHIDQHVVTFDRKHRSLDHGTFCEITVAEAFLQQCREVFLECSVGSICHICSHNLS